MTDRGPVDLGRIRRTRASSDNQDSREWTVEDAVVDFLECLRGLPEEARPTQLVILARRPFGDDGDHREWCSYAGVLTSDVALMLLDELFEVQARRLQE